MFTVYAIKDNTVIHIKTSVTEQFLNITTAVMEACTNCDTITVLRSNGSIVSQERIDRPVVCEA